MKSWILACTDHVGGGESLGQIPSGKEVAVSRSALFLGFATLVSLFISASASAQDGNQRYPVAYVDRPLTLPSFGLSPDVTFDATQIVQDPNAVERTLQTNIAFAAGLTFGITEDLEARASIGTLRIMPEFQYLEPRVGVTFRFVGAEQFNMGIRAETTALTLPGEAGVRLEASIPFLIRMGSSARLDLAPGAPITIQEQKAVTFGLNVPLAFAFQVVEALHIGARTSVAIVDFANPGENLTIPLGFFVGLSLGSERPIVEIDPYFTWNEFSKPGAKFDNDKVNIEKFSAGATAKLYLYL
ncbi:MAG: hypothetical protein IPK82_40105 [Polyangiaceae bacterium]|nr:hypothetical protein [Polyangiaceae bacterium]